MLHEFIKWLTTINNPEPLYDITLGSFFRSVLLVGCNWNPPSNTTTNVSYRRRLFGPKTFVAVVKREIVSISPEKKPKKLKFP